MLSRKKWDEGLPFLLNVSGHPRADDINFQDLAAGARLGEKRSAHRRRSRRKKKRNKNLADDTQIGY